MAEEENFQYFDDNLPKISIWDPHNDPRVSKDSNGGHIFTLGIVLLFVWSATITWLTRHYFLSWCFSSYGDCVDEKESNKLLKPKRVSNEPRTPKGASNELLIPKGVSNEPRTPKGVSNEPPIPQGVSNKLLIPKAIERMREKQSNRNRRQMSFRKMALLAEGEVAV